ncbi:putative RNA recognition motif domain, nucleotide-binding alpha-beta plait domain superfamily [Helianthus annuus]|uniref:RNA recognition motif domain, nucleotide-binding alpha-beta plait domain superfamily n=1 Tax=Helianthus annuus TaxID=4232 RepID=A0A9K3JS36_HELAN|nr:putative RNA recognition motif domain, nucleotide-binding alpha-beta plait domain superfamily [Helianthus annuus]KAJ0787176.1 putative RNA recognition motif domain, nucleotide-binding alpha-beta plait domain superfamily [Helianthus annuus]
MSGDSRRLDPDGWEFPRSRQGRRNDRSSDVHNKVLSKFFVSNLPPKCSSQDLKEVLSGYGKYEGSYIARKLDKWGKRFAFVTFSEVVDVSRLENELSDVWLGSFKLFITIARFVDGKKVSRPDSVQKEKTDAMNNVRHANPSSGGSDGGGSMHATVGNGRSFVDSLLNRNKVDVINIDDSVERFSHWSGCALRGRVVDLNTLTSLNQLLKKKGWKSLDIKYLGGFSVALVFYDSGDAESFLKDTRSWSGWFEVLHPWDDGGYVEEGRIAWLQVHGVPAQLAMDQVFDVIANRYGKVVQSASISGDINNLSYALIGVLSKVCKRIVDRVDVNWRGHMFNVWVDEDVGEWVPECIVELEEDECSLQQHDETQAVDLNVEREEGELPQFEVLVNDHVEVEDNGQCNSTHDTVEGVDGSEGLSGTQSCLSKGRKKFRRKSLFKNRNEGSGSLERPKKRPREITICSGWIV